MKIQISHVNAREQHCILTIYESGKSFLNIRKNEIENLNIPSNHSTFETSVQEYMGISAELIPIIVELLKK